MSSTTIMVGNSLDFITLNFLVVFDPSSARNKSISSIRGLIIRNGVCDGGEISIALVLALEELRRSGEDVICQDARTPNLESFNGSLVGDAGVIAMICSSLYDFRHLDTSLLAILALPRIERA
ncbi:hypothetical protein Tco_1092962 [Tanacetum coccineum]|uniref:Uncharacterized protein n=1 Tax=Tanacetum coccineum TaxID=301880 RepID=A0ABQ5ICN3_9ASTR